MLPTRVLLALALLTAAERPPPAPPFARYPARVVPVARAAAPRLVAPLSRHYRTGLGEAARGPVDFAGHYVLAKIGCGAACIRVAAIDRVSGGVAWFPATISGWPLEVSEPLAYRRTSRLLVVQGELDEQEPSLTRAYLFDGTRFIPLAG